MRYARVLPLFCSLALTSLWATSIRPASVETLTSQSSVVIEGVAKESWSEWDAEHHLIYTITRVEVGKALKGSPSESVFVRQLGGSVAGITQRISGVRHLVPGEEAVLFLEPIELHDGTMAIVGLMQGQFHITRSEAGEPMASNGIPVVVSPGQQEPHAAEPRISLSALEQRIQRAR